MSLESQQGGRKCGESQSWIAEMREWDPWRESNDGETGAACRGHRARRRSDRAITVKTETTSGTEARKTRICRIRTCGGDGDRSHTDSAAHCITRKQARNSGSIQITSWRRMSDLYRHAFQTCCDPVRAYILSRVSEVLILVAWISIHWVTPQVYNKATERWAIVMFNLRSADSHWS